MKCSESHASDPKNSRAREAGILLLLIVAAWLVCANNASNFLMTVVGDDSPAERELSPFAPRNNDPAKELVLC